MKQSFKGNEFTHTPREQIPSQHRSTPEISAQHHIGRWGRMHRAYLEEVHPDLYRQLLQDGALDRHLSEVDGRAVHMLEHLTAQMARQEGVTERMKAEEPMAWVSRMNGIRSRAEEIIRDRVINNL